MSLADAQNEESPPSFTVEEQAKIRKLKFKGDVPWGQDPRFFAKKPNVDELREWYEDHYSKLRGLEQAEGKRRGSW